MIIAIYQRFSIIAQVIIEMRSRSDCSRITMLFKKDMKWTLDQRNKILLLMGVRTG